MKKHLLQLSLAATLAIPASALAQNIFPTNGNVGIGTSLPDANLTISGSAYSGAESSFVGAHIKNVADGGDASLWLQNSSKNAYIRLKNNYASEWLKIDDGTNSRMAIDNSGNVGIGTSSPRNKLTILKALGSDDFVNSQHAYQFQIESGLGVYGSRSMGIGVLDNGKGVIQVKESNAGYNDLLLNPVAGNVGIGTATPQARFHVVGSALFDFSGAGGGRLNIGSNPSDNRVYIQASNSAGTESAQEMILAGNSTRSLPKFSVVANESAFSGKITTTTLELISDRNRKQDSRPVSAAEVLTKVAALPVTTWAYTNTPSVRHLGPMAQDFKTSFDLGEDDKHISAGDGIGVALAAIQGLHELVKDRDSEIIALKRELAGMKQELATVKDIITDRLAALEMALPKNAVQQVKE